MYYTRAVYNRKNKLYLVFDVHVADLFGCVNRINWLSLFLLHCGIVESFIEVLKPKAMDEDRKVKIDKFEGRDFGFWRMTIEDYLNQKKLNELLTKKKLEAGKQED